MVSAALLPRPWGIAPEAVFRRRLSGRVDGSLQADAHRYANGTLIFRCKLLISTPAVQTTSELSSHRPKLTAHCRVARTQLGCLFRMSRAEPSRRRSASDRVTGASVRQVSCQLPSIISALSLIQCYFHCQCRFISGIDSVTVRRADGVANAVNVRHGTNQGAGRRWGSLRHAQRLGTRLTRVPACRTLLLSSQSDALTLRVTERDGSKCVLFIGQARSDACTTPVDNG